jgi:hypothetical protein
MSCLVITDLEEFGRRFASAAAPFLESKHSQFGHRFRVIARDACGHFEKPLADEGWT